MRAGTASRVLLPESRRRVFFLACVRVHGPASLQPASSSSSPPSWLQLVEVVASSFVMAESSNHPSRPLQLSSKPRPHMTKLPRRRRLAYRGWNQPRRRRSFNATKLLRRFSSSASPPRDLSSRPGSAPPWPWSASLWLYWSSPSKRS
ncbi:hypothetical protein YC2023_015808 [Brassica napus]